MSTKTDACNLALYHLGQTKRIADIEEQSKEANACRVFFDDTVDEVLRDFVWPFATRQVKLALVSQIGDEEHPSDEWAYAYRKPTDCLFARRIPSGTRNDTRASRVPYRIVADEVGDLILCDKPRAELEYTSKIGRNLARWNADFKFSFSFRLAAYIAPGITGSDPFKVGEKSLQLWNMSFRKARANAANEEQPDEQPEGELIQARC